MQSVKLMKDRCGALKVADSKESFRKVHQSARSRHSSLTFQRFFEKPERVSDRPVLYQDHTVVYGYYSDHSSVSSSPGSS